MTTVFRPSVPAIDPWLRDTFYGTSPRPSGFNVPRSPWSEDDEKLKIFKPVANVLSLRSRPSEKSTIRSRTMPAILVDKAIFSSPKGTGEIRSLSPAFPSEDSYSDLWDIDKTKFWKDIYPAKVASSRGQGGRYKTPQLCEQPAVRRQLSSPRVTLQFEESKHTRYEESDTDEDVDAMKFSTYTRAAGRKRHRHEAQPQEGSKTSTFACDACRIAKTKCQGFPCSRCLRVGKECIRSSMTKDSDNLPSVKRPKQVQPVKACYRNSWCIRPYRHPGHCRHISWKSRARSKKKQRV